MAWHGEAWRSRLGGAGLGVAWLGKAVVTARLGMAVAVWCGMARQGEVGPGG